MTTSSVVRDRDFLQTLIPGFEAAGFSVFLHPAREMLPPFMHNYRPDAIAAKGDKKIAIEIIRQAIRDGSRMEQLQELFGKHPDWEFRVYYIPDDAADESVEVSALSEIDSVLADVNQLKRTGYLKAALTIGWAALEAASRAALPQNLARPQVANKLVETLASEGMVTPSEADSLRKIVSLRNAITHGHFSVRITEEDVDQVIAAATLIRGLAEGQRPS